MTEFSSDNFYNPLLPGTIPDNHDFDHPSSLNFDMMYECLLQLYNGKQTVTPVYNFSTHSASPNEFLTLLPRKVVIFEGILSMYDERIRSLFDLQIFVNLDLDLALSRRIIRDIKERGRDLKEVLHRFHTFVKKDYNTYVKDQMRYANLIIPGTNNNESVIISCC